MIDDANVRTSTTASRRSRCPTTRPTSTARATSPARSSASRAPARSRTPPGSSCKYLTTDTDAVVSFANAIHNVPSTHGRAGVAGASTRTRTSRRSSRSRRTRTATRRPSSPNGGAYQLTLQDLGYAYESGKQTDLQAGLDEAAEQIDTDIAQAQ